MSTEHDRDRLSLLQGTLDLSVTPAGRKQLGKETAKWRRLAAAIGRILDPVES